MTKRIIHIFKNDLRLSDNPSLTEASKAGHIIPIYIVWYPSQFSSCPMAL